MLVVPAQYPEAAAKEIRRLGGRDEFVGVFLPGGARIPYGNPTYDPLWEAVNELGLPVAIHTHYENVGIAGTISAAGMPDYYVEYHTLCGSGMYGHFVSILCHGIFERFPDTRVAMVEGGLVPYVGFLWRLDTNWRSCRSEIPWCKRRPSDYVWEHVRFATQPLESPDDPAQLLAAIEFLRPWDTLMYASDFPHWDFDEPEQTLRQLPSEWRENVRWRNAHDFFRLPGADARMTTAGREARIPVRDAPAEGAVRIVDVGGHRVGLYRVAGDLHALADRCPHRGARLCAGRVATPIELGAGEVTVGAAEQHRSLPVAQVGVRDRDGPVPRRPAPPRPALRGPHRRRRRRRHARSAVVEPGARWRHFVRGSGVSAQLAVDDVVVPDRRERRRVHVDRHRAGLVLDAMDAGGSGGERLAGSVVDMAAWTVHDQAPRCARDPRARRRRRTSRRGRGSRCRASPTTC